MNKILLIFLVLSLTACFHEKTKIESTVDYNGFTILITTHLFDTQKQMHVALKARGSDISPKLLGKAFWLEWVDKKTGKGIVMPNIMPTCEIYAVKPKNVNDSAMLTMGHELTHYIYIYGSFHK